MTEFAVSARKISLSCRWLRPVAALMACSAIAASAAMGDELDALATWSDLDVCQAGVTQARLESALDTLYVPSGKWRDWIRFEEGAALLKRGAGDYRLELAKSEEAQLSLARRRGLRGLRIALDPGHIGGAWGQLEERSFAIGDGPRVQEGDLTLATALRLKALLEAAGAEVWLTRSSAEPVTSERPENFAEEAAARLPGDENGLVDEATAKARTRLARRLFYVTSEIRARARALESFRPDVALALHLNARGWKDPENPALVAENNGHVIVHGCYLADELANEEDRVLMLRRLCRGYDQVELPLGRALAEAMVEKTGLPPYRYEGDNACPLDADGYLWARNLLANRAFDCPVVYLEPWILNSEPIYPWAAEGDYEGEREIGGISRKSIPVVYAGFVMDGLLAYYGAGD